MKYFTTAIGAIALGAGLASTAWAQTDLSMWYHGAGNAVEVEDHPQDHRRLQRQPVRLEGQPAKLPAGGLQRFRHRRRAGRQPARHPGHGRPEHAELGLVGLSSSRWTSPESKIADFLPGTKGIYNGKLYSIGLWDAAVALYARKSTLDELHLRTPTLDKPWTKDEFMHALKAAKDSGKFKYALDLGMNDQGEWYPYAFSPFLQSFGGDIVDRSNYQTAEGALNGDAAIAFGNWWQGLFKDGYAPGPSEDPAAQQNGFINGDFAFQWNGNWRAVDTMKQVKDVEFLPAPDFGHGPKIGTASWQFGVSAQSKHPEGAAKFIEFALQDKYLADFSNGIGLIPATTTAANMVPNYKPGGPLHVFYQYSKVEGVKRPVTPGYVVEFEDLHQGADGHRPGCRRDRHAGRRGGRHRRRHQEEQRLQAALIRSAPGPSRRP